jgi:nitroreductase
MTKSHALLGQRYGREPDWAKDAELNPVLETIFAHRSVRGFLSDALPSGTLELLVAAAQSAASSSNLQVWSVVSVEDPARKERIAQHAGNQAHIREAPLFLAWLADTSRIARIAERDGQPADGLRFLDSFLMGGIDAALAAQNAVTAAESLGLGTVYIGALRNRPEAVAEDLGLPKGVFPLFGLCVGKPDPARQALVKPRLAQSAVLHREQYEHRSLEHEVANYDDTLQAFYDGQQQAHPRWSAHVRERLRSSESLRGRDRLKQALHGFGFELL